MAILQHGENLVSALILTTVVVATVECVSISRSAPWQRTVSQSQRVMKVFLGPKNCKFYHLFTVMLSCLIISC